MFPIKLELRNFFISQLSNKKNKFDQTHILIPTYTILTFIIILEESFHIHFIPLTSLLKINSI